MKSLTSKFLAVALLLSVVSPVSAVTLDDLKQKASDGWEKTKEAANTFHEYVTKPYEANKWKTSGVYEDEGEAIRNVKSRIGLGSPVSFSEKVDAIFTDLVKRNYRLFTSDHSYLANGIYYPLLIAGTAAAGYGIYKATTALKNLVVGNTTKKNAAKYKELRAAAWTIIDSGEGSLLEKYKELGIKDKALEQVVTSFDIIFSNNLPEELGPISDEEKGLAITSILEQISSLIPAEVEVTEVEEAPAGK